jgi:hypothetical protein
MKMFFAAEGNEDNFESCDEDRKTKVFQEKVIPASKEKNQEKVHFLEQPKKRRDESGIVQFDCDENDDVDVGRLLNSDSDSNERESRERGRKKDRE